MEFVFHPFATTMPGWKIQALSAVPGSATFVGHDWVEADGHNNTSSKPARYRGQYPAISQEFVSSLNTLTLAKSLPKSSIYIVWPSASCLRLLMHLACCAANFAP